MRRYFATGLVILLPLAVTLFVVIFLFNLLTEPFSGVIRTVFDYYHIFDKGFLFFSAVQIQTFVAQILTLAFFFFFTVGLGVLARWFFIHYLIRFWEYTIHKIPVVGTIYKTSKDVIETLFASKTTSFKQVVLIPFPSKDSLSIGLLTAESVENMYKDQKEALLAVFVPTTPSPISGYLLFYKAADVIFTDMKVEDAIKLVVSCGVVSPSQPLKIDV